MSNIEEPKLLQVFCRGGMQLNILTRMPTSEIIKEVWADSYGRDVVELSALNHAGDLCDVKIMRSEIVATFLEKFTPPAKKQIQPVVAVPGLVKP